MKKLMILAVLVMILTGSFAQVRKDKLPKPTGNSSTKQKYSPTGPKEDSILVRFTKFSDTSKVRITVYVEDNTLSWFKGYMLKHNLRFGPNDIKQDGPSLYYDEQFQLIQEKDILSVSLFNW